MKHPDLASRLLHWYTQRARKLPWRENPDAYTVWVSEIMLQQTRVETVIPYFERWMVRFPSIEKLAAASQQEVLAAWEGLGYYSRARNLHRAAQIVARELGGALPKEPQALMKLPGIGRYTAGAIASIAFGLDEPALDGNIRRVLARVFDVSEPARSPEGERLLWELATAHLPAGPGETGTGPGATGTGQAGEYNQALMDLGATVCTPRAPDCPSCPLAEICLARQLGVQEQRPVRQPKRSVPHYAVSAAVILRDGKVLITQRPAGGLLGGLWEFPGGKLEPGEDFSACLQREICEELDVAVGVGERLGVYHHAYTHFRVTVHAFYCELPREADPQPVQVDDLRWEQPSDLPAYPMGKVDRQIARDLSRLRWDLVTDRGLTPAGLQEGRRQ